MDIAVFQLVPAFIFYVRDFEINKLSTRYLVALCQRFHASKRQLVESETNIR